MLYRIYKLVPISFRNETPKPKRRFAEAVNIAE